MYFDDEKLTPFACQVSTDSFCAPRTGNTPHMFRPRRCAETTLKQRERERDGSGKLINRLVGDADRTGASLAACLFRVAS